MHIPGATPADAGHRAGSFGALRTTEVDGIPTLYVESPQSLTAMLSFRVGVADETLVSRGITHLVEHIAMHELVDSSVSCNAQVGPLVTDFFVQGAPEDVSGFLNALVRWFREPDLGSSEHERSILEAESRQRANGIFDLHTRFRFGAMGFGLVGYGEFGLARISEDDLREWIGTRFVGANAVLALTGPPPMGLDMALPTGERQQVPRMVAIPPNPPYYFAGPEGMVSASGLFRRAELSSLVGDITSNAVTERLRKEQGASYGSSHHMERVDADNLVLMVSADLNADPALPVARNATSTLHREVMRLSASGPTPEELRNARTPLLRQLDDDLTRVWQAFSGATAVLRGTDPWTHEEARDAIADADSDTLRESFGELARSLIVASPCADRAMTTLPFTNGIVPAPAAVGGTEFRPVGAPADQSILQVGTQVLEIRGPGTLHRASYDDIVAYERYPDGARVVWTKYGNTIGVESAAWRDSGKIATSLDDRIDRSLWVDREARTDIPHAREFMLSRADRYWYALNRPWARALVYGLIAVILGAAVAVSHLLGLVLSLTVVGVARYVERRLKRKIAEAERKEANAS
ncbi:MAG: hypothetical protein QM655_16595 [Nocardioidaceae bacterium]